MVPVRRHSQITAVCPATHQSRGRQAEDAQRPPNPDAEDTILLRIRVRTPGGDASEAQAADEVEAEPFAVGAAGASFDDQLSDGQGLREGDQLCDHTVRTRKSCGEGGNNSYLRCISKKSS